MLVSKEIEKITYNKELLVRKKMASFIEKLLRCLDYDFRHDIFKQIIYSEIAVKTPLEEWIKNSYDAFCYLLNNRQNPCTSELLQKFFYLLKGKEISKMQTIHLSSKYFYLQDCPVIERAVRFHMLVFQELIEFEEKERIFISFMFFNYALVKGDIPCVRILKKQYPSYLKARQSYIEGDEMKFIDYMIQLVLTSKFQKKSYYKKLHPIHHQEIIHQFKKDKKILNLQYGIKHLYLFGSFAKGLERIDSDIDLIVVFHQDLLLDEKEQILKKLSENYYFIFHRFIDFIEISTHVSEEIVKEITTYKIIF